MKSTTRKAREIAMQHLYGYEMTGDRPELEGAAPEGSEDVPAALEGITDDPESQEDREFIDRILGLFASHGSDVDELIRENSLKWSLDRISRVDLAILRLSLLEMTYMGTPEKVAINEAVELAKKYSGDNAYRFVNGVLAGYVKKRRTKE